MWDVAIDPAPDVFLEMCYLPCTVTIITGKQSTRYYFVSTSQKQGSVLNYPQWQNQPWDKFKDLPLTHRLF
jgi:hypothetical protein